MKNKVAIIIGHHNFSEGAFSKWLGESEWTFWLNFAEEYLDDIGNIFIHDPDIKGYTTGQKDMAERTKDYDLAIELHFNSFNGKAFGCEALYYDGNNTTEKVSERFSELCSERLGYKNRGVKGRSLKTKNKRGAGFLYYQKPAALILEPFFGDNEKDCNRFDELKFKQIIQDTIDFFFEIKKD